MKRIPIKVARELAQKYGQAIVCVVTWQPDGRQHVVTYGETREQCAWAADLGNQIKRKILGWPEEMCHAVPDRRMVSQKLDQEVPYPCSGLGCRELILSGVFCPSCQEDEREDPGCHK